MARDESFLLSDTRLVGCWGHYTNSKKSLIILIKIIIIRGIQEKKYALTGDSAW